MDLVIEEDFLDIISSMIRELPYSDIYQHDAPQTSQSFLTKEDPLQVSTGMHFLWHSTGTKSH